MFCQFISGYKGKGDCYPFSLSIFVALPEVSFFSANNVLVPWLKDGFLELTFSSSPPSQDFCCNQTKESKLSQLRA